jgi:dTDP-4-amino-4,6-dideoxygalactose transaminase
MGRSLGGRPGQCPVSERAGDCLVRLPFYNELTPVDQDAVIEAICKFVP